MGRLGEALAARRGVRKALTMSDKSQRIEIPGEFKNTMPVPQVGEVFYLPEPTPESNAAWKAYFNAVADPELEVHLFAMSWTDHGIEPDFTVRRRNHGAME